MTDWQEPGRYKKHVVALLERQVAAQEQAIEYARERLREEESTRAVVVSTLEHQTRELRASLEKSDDRLADELERQGDYIASKIEEQGALLEEGLERQGRRIAVELSHLGGRICKSLDEIRFEVVHLGTTMNRLLETVQNSRNNEARQLVRQGVRHLLNDEYSEAEQRFLRALDFDTTDYQVLMNLGVIAVHEGRLESALTYFNKALKLPESLDSSAKARALWAIARVRFAMDRFSEVAYAAALEAKAHSNPNSGAEVLELALYAAPLGRKGIAIEHCRQALLVDPSLFSTIAAYAELELVSIREEVWTLLRQMARDALAHAMNHLEGARQGLLTAAKSSQASQYGQLVSLTKARIDQAEEWLGHASYGDCLSFHASNERLLEIIQSISKLDAKCSNLSVLAKLPMDSDSDLSKHVQKSKDPRIVPEPHEPMPDVPAPMKSPNLHLPALYVFAVLGYTAYGPFEFFDFIFGAIVMILFFPFFVLASLIDLLLGSRLNPFGIQRFFGAGLGALVVVIYWAVRLALVGTWQKNREAILRENELRGERNRKRAARFLEMRQRIFDAESRAESDRKAVLMAKQEIETLKEEIHRQLTIGLSQIAPNIWSAAPSDA